MSGPVTLADASLADFAGQLAARTPTPGGGSVAAHLAALGAALAAMACRFTSGAKYASCESAMAERAERLDALRVTATGLIDTDSAAYDAVSAAMKLPKGTDAEKAARTRAVQQALRGALEVPFRTLETAVAALRLTAAAAPDVNPNLASDCATAGYCLWSAAESARMNVRINAASIQDPEYVEKRSAATRELEREARAHFETVRDAMEAKLA
ncbi:MAG: cyclodeaminase/cyclohydrolase family protein [Planctomycetota bacterium]